MKDIVFNRILFVCLGNICRSPAAEAVMRHLAPYVGVDSAGVVVDHIGEPPYSLMADALRSCGYAVPARKARLVRADDFETYDLIYVMDEEVRTAVEALRPRGNRTPVTLFTQNIDEGPDAVADPYYTRDFEGCVRLIEQCAYGHLSLDRVLQP